MKDGLIISKIADGASEGGTAQTVGAPIWWPRGPDANADLEPDRLRRAIAGTVLARPWFDRASMLALRHMMFPASRLWAAAQVAEGDIERFEASVPIGSIRANPQKVTRLLAEIAEARVAAEAMNTEWERAFFGAKDYGPLHLCAVEAARLNLSDASNQTRWRLRTTIRQGVPRASMQIQPPSAIRQVYGDGIAAFASLSAPPPMMPEVGVSRSFPTRHGNDFWLRFQSPSARLGDTVHARVHEPRDAENAPTIIFGHGICVEFDHWKGLLDECQTLVRRGFRVIRPEAPWHGRRKPPGCFGGERTIAAFPVGLLDSFAGSLQEWAVLADWARRRSTGPLAFGGSSLGAMTAQLAASRSAAWPLHLRPDALFLVTHTGDMAAAVLDGALSTMWAPREVAERAGWTTELAWHYLSLVNPVDPMPMPPHRIVSILGRRDRVLPFESGRRLVQHWKVPASNSFIWDRGHFSVPTTLIRTTAPLDRLAQVVANIRPAARNS